MATWFAAHNTTAADPNSIQAVVPFEGDYTGLLTGDMCILYDEDNGFLRIYEYDSTSSATQDIPNIITSDGNSGNGRWLQREMSLDNRFFQGLMADKFSAVVTSDGATVTMTITNVEGGDLTLIHPSGRYTLTGGSTLALTPGSDSSPTENYVYVLESAPQTLTHSTSDWPTANHVKIAFFLLPSAAEVQDHGAWINQNWNDGTRSDETGHLEHMAENMRLTMGGSVYHSGCDGNGSDDFIDITINGGANDNVFWKTTAGVSYQMHRHTIPAYDMGTGDDAHVVNWNGDAYHEIADLNEITADSTGASITNKYFNVVFWFANNKTGEYSPLMANLPTGSYATLTNAVNDTDGHDVYDIPKAFNRESSTGMLVARVTFRYTTAASGTWVVHNTTDLRGRTPGTASGTSLASQVEFPDNTFRIFDEADDTKELAFSVGGFTTSTTRTITPPDEDVTFDRLWSGGIKSVTAEANGIAVYDTSGTDSNVTFYNSTPTLQARILSSASALSFDLWTGAAWEDAITANHNGAVELYYDNAKVLSTNAGGIIVQDNSGANPDIRLRDDAGTEHGRITSGATNFYLQLWNGAAYEKGFHFDLSGSATVYYDDIKALATDAAGIVVYDTSGTDSIIQFRSSASALQARLDSSATDFSITVGASSENALVANLNGAVELYYNNLKAFATAADGIHVIDTAADEPNITLYDNADTSMAVWEMSASGNMLFDCKKTSADVYIRSKDSGDNTTNLVVGNPDGAVDLYYDGVKAVSTYQTVPASSGAGLQVFDSTGAEGAALMKTLNVSATLAMAAGTYGDYWRIGGEDSGAGFAASMIILPHSYTEIRQNEVKVFKTMTDGFALYDSDGDDPIFRMYEDDASTLAFEISSVSGTDVYLKSYRHDGNLWLSGETAGGLLRYVGIDVGDPSFRPSPDSTLTCGNSSYCWSNIYGDAGVTSCSDKKYKKDIQQTSLGLSFINDLVPVAFKFNKTGKRPKNHDRVYQGMLANEVEAALQEHGHTYTDFAGIEESFDDDGDRWLGLKYEQFIAPLIKAVQELSAQVDELKKEKTSNGS
jgi:hypothetical protein